MFNFLNSATSTSDWDTKDNSTDSNIPSVTNFDESFILESEDLSEILYFHDIRSSQCAIFDQYLMLLEPDQQHFRDNVTDIVTDTPVPKFIGCLVLVLRKKFEEELDNHICFLEAKTFPTNSHIKRMASQVFHHSGSLQSLSEVTNGANGLLLFCTLLEILRRFERRVLQFSRRIADFSMENSIMRLCPPDDQVIRRHISSYIDRVYLKKEVPLKEKKRETEDTSLTRLGQLIQAYYVPDHRSMERDLTMRNEFHMLMYHDLRNIGSAMQRYIARFVLRNCLYFLRRYVFATSARIRLLRKESWATMLVSRVPEIQSFAVHRMAEFLASTIVEVSDEVEPVDAGMAILKNVFSLQMESFWFRQRRETDVYVNPVDFKCHRGCICEFG